MHDIRTFDIPLPWCRNLRFQWTWRQWEFGAGMDFDMPFPWEPALNLGPLTIMVFEVAPKEWFEEARVRQSDQFGKAADRE